MELFPQSGSLVFVFSHCDPWVFLALSALPVSLTETQEGVGSAPSRLGDGCQPCYPQHPADNTQHLARLPSRPVIERSCDVKYFSLYP